MLIPVVPDFNSAVGRKPPVALDIIIAKRLVIGMAFHKDRIKNFIAILLDDHATDGIADFMDDPLGAFWNHERARVKFQQSVRNTNHTVILADLDHDVFCLQLRLDLAQHLLKRLLDLFDLLDFLIHFLAFVDKLQDKRHRNQNKQDQQAGHNIRKGNPVRVFLIDAATIIVGGVLFHYGLILPSISSTTSFNAWMALVIVVVYSCVCLFHSLSRSRVWPLTLSA